MSDPRYKADVLKGIKLSGAPGNWPESLPGYGDRRGGQPMSRCVLCRENAPPSAYTTFVRYGDVYLCKKHAIEESGRSASADGT